MAKRKRAFFRKRLRGGNGCFGKADFGKTDFGKGGRGTGAAASPSGSPKQATVAIGNIIAAPRSMKLKERTKCQVSFKWSSIDWGIGAPA